MRKVSFLNSFLFPINIIPAKKIFQTLKLWVRYIFAFFIALRPAHSLAENVHFHHFYRSEMTGSPIYLSGKLDANWSDVQKAPSFYSQRAQLDRNERLLVVKHPHSHNQKASFQPVRLKLYFKSFLPDWIACHLSWPSDIRLQTDPEKPYELHILQGSINSGCSQLLSDTEAIPFAPVDDSKYGFYPYDLWLIEFPPLKQFHQKRSNDNFGVPGISDSKDSRELLSGYYSGDSGFKFDFKPGGGGSNVMDINVAFSILPTAREKGGEDQPVLVPGSQEGVSIEVADAQGDQWQRFYTMDEARELLVGVEDGEELLSRLQRSSLFVKAGKIEDLSSVCRESIRRVAQLAEVREQLLSDFGEIDQQSDDADKFSVPGVISFGDKDEKNGGGSKQPSSNKQGSSAQPSRTSSASNTPGGGATEGDDERDDDGKPREKIRSQCETSDVGPLVLQQKLSGQQDEEMAESDSQPLRKRKLEKTLSQLSLSTACGMSVVDSAYKAPSVEETSELVEADSRRAIHELRSNVTPQKKLSSGGAEGFSSCVVEERRITRLPTAVKNERLQAAGPQTPVNQPLGQWSSFIPSLQKDVDNLTHIMAPDDPPSKRASVRTLSLSIPAGETLKDPEGRLIKTLKVIEYAYPPDQREAVERSGGMYIVLEHETGCDLYKPDDKYLGDWRMRRRLLPEYGAAFDNVFYFPTMGQAPQLVPERYFPFLSFLHSRGLIPVMMEELYADEVEEFYDWHRPVVAKILCDSLSNDSTLLENAKRHGSHLVALGCGSGCDLDLMSKALKEEGVNTIGHGLEIYQSLVAKAKSKYPHLSFTEADASHPASEIAKAKQGNPLAPESPTIVLAEGFLTRYVLAGSESWACCHSGAFAGRHCRHGGYKRFGSTFGQCGNGQSCWVDSTSPYDLLSRE